MASISTTSYILDSRDRAAGSTLNVAKFNFATLGSPVEPGTYEVLSFSSRNGVYNVDDSNDEIYFDEDAGAEEGPALIVHGYYTTPALLGAAVKVAMEAAGSGTYTIVYTALTNTFNIAVAAGATTFNFNWGDNLAQPMANLLLGFDKVNTADVANVDSTQGIDLDPHTSLLLDIAEDSLKNITLVDGSEHSLNIPLNTPYASEIDGMKNETFSQTVQFVSPMNELNVTLRTEDGVLLPVLNSAPYQLIIRKLF